VRQWGQAQPDLTLAELGECFCHDASLGRAARGMRVHDAVPKNFGRNMTMLGASSCHGLEAVMTLGGATDATVFRAFVMHVLTVVC
jgi:hypothetical protein